MSDRRLRHGYTNETWAAGGSVVKHYLGPDGEQRMLQELAAIEAVASAVPTAKVLSVHRRERRVEFARVAGVPGQDLIEQGYANNVMKAAGRALAALHSHPEVQVTHGDYGPQNLLLDATGEAVVLVADWEFSFAGRDPLTDLAWAEWIVRMHHPAAASSIYGLFAGYGHTPPWDDRKRVMLRRCEWLRAAAHPPTMQVENNCGRSDWRLPRVGPATQATAFRYAATPLPRHDPGLHGATVASAHGSAVRPHSPRVGAATCRTE